MERERTVESRPPPKKKARVEKSSATSLLRSLSVGSKKSNASSSQAQIWLEKFKPDRVEDLVVHKKKVEEVESWLVKLQEPDNRSRILLMTGASGSGKLTTLRVLCKKLGYGLTEWANPLPSEINYDGDLSNYRSQLKAFAEFIVRATRYRSVLVSSQKKRLIVVKEVPNVFLRDGTLFHECLSQYSGVKDLNLVFIISDSLICRELFPDALKTSTGTTTINFNPVTQRSITLTLQKIVKKSGIIRSLSGDIESVSESCNGDLRNAIMSLHFLSVRPKNSGDETLFAKPRTKDKNIKEISDHLDLFRGLGRVLYSKKDERGNLVHDPEAVVGCFDSVANTFVSMLHENYLSIFSCVRDVSRASNYLASSELILNDWRENKLSRNYALSTAVYGTVLNNREPVKKFQQMKKFSNLNGLEPNLKKEIQANFPNFRERDFLVDVKSYFRQINKNCPENQASLINELSLKNNRHYHY